VLQTSGPAPNEYIRPFSYLPRTICSTGAIPQMWCTDGTLPRNNFLSPTAAAKNRAVCANSLSITYLAGLSTSFFIAKNNLINVKWPFMGNSTCTTTQTQVN